MAHVGLADWLRGAEGLDDSVPHFMAAVDTLQLLLELQFEMTGLVRQLLDTLRGFREVLRALGRDGEADDVESRIDVLEREHPQSDGQDED